METHRLILVTNVILRLVQVHFQFFAPLRLCEKFSFSLFYSFTLLAPLSRKAGLSEAKQKIIYPTIISGFQLKTTFTSISG